MTCRPRRLPLIAALFLLSCGTDDPGTEAPAEFPPETPAPASPVTVRSVTPTSGPVGSKVTVRAGGLPPGAQAEFGFGAPNSNFEVLGRAPADSVGEVTTELTVPSWATPGTGYMFVVGLVDRPPSAMSDTFRVTPPRP